MAHEGQLRWTYVGFLLIVCLLNDGAGASSLRIKHSTQDIGQSSNGTTNHLNQHSTVANSSRQVDLPSDGTDTANKNEKKNRERKKDNKKRKKDNKKRKNKNKNKQNTANNVTLVNQTKDELRPHLLQNGNGNQTSGLQGNFMNESNPLENKNDTHAQDLFNDTAASSHLGVDGKTLNGSSLGEEGNATFRDSIVNGSSTGDQESAVPRDQIGTANGSLGADNRINESSMDDYDDRFAGSRSSILATKGHGDNGPSEGRASVGGSSGRKRPGADSLGDVKKTDGSAAPRTFGQARVDQPSSEDSRPGFPWDRPDGPTPPQDEQGQGRGRTMVSGQDPQSPANSGGGRDGGKKTAGTKTGTSPLLDADVGERSDGGDVRNFINQDGGEDDMGEIDPKATRKDANLGGFVVMQSSTSHGNPRLKLSYGLTATLVGLSAFVIELYIL